MSSELTGARAAVDGPRAAVRTDNFDTYVSANYESLVRIAYLMTHDWGHAEDLVQTTLVKCWARWTHIAADNPTAYVRRALMNNYFNWWRRSWINKERPTDLDVQVVTVVDRYEAIENSDLIQALSALPKRMRAVVVLRYYEDLSEAQTAAVLGCSIGTVKSQTHRALARLSLDPTLQATRKQP